MLNLGRVAQLMAGRLIVRSALNPLLWLCGIVSLPCFVLVAVLDTVGHPHPVLIASLLVAGFLPLLLVCGVAVYFVCVSPERLQSEDYQIKHQSLQILQSATGPQVIDAEAIVAIANPALLPPHEGGAE